MSKKTLNNFPFECVETTGEQALETWEKLKSEYRGVPLILGGKDWPVDWTMTIPSASNATDILNLAAKLKHPDNLQSAQEGFDMPEIGEWPTKVHASRGLTVAYDHSGKPLEKVYIALIPSDDWTTIPAHLQWGGWNACPNPEQHVAALRSWRDRFGAELVGLSGDIMDIRVTRRPQTRRAALDLAREQYWYCNDTIDQGAGTLSAEAASLMADDWWNFWWD